MHGGIHIPRGQTRGRGVHEMTMIDHEGEEEGFLNDHVVRWIVFWFRGQSPMLILYHNHYYIHSHTTRIKVSTTKF